MGFTNVGLVEYCKAQVGNPYIYGTFGQIGNAKLLSSKHEQYPNYVTAKRVEIVKANPSKYFDKPWHDCSGLVKGYLMRKGLTVVYCPTYDLSADGFYNKSTRKGGISSIPEIKGLGLWKKNHFGVYIGNGRCIQAKGFDYGVVESDLTGFTNWCEIPFIEYDSSAVADPIQLPRPNQWQGFINTVHLPLNIRATSDPNSRILGVVPKHSIQMFVGEPENGMAKLADREGWCSMLYIIRK